MILSVYSGLEKYSIDIQNNITPDIIITSNTDKFFTLDSIQEQEIKGIKEILYHSKTLVEKAFFTYREKKSIAYLKGVDNNYTNINRLDTLLYKGRYFKYDRKEAIVGSVLSRKMDMSIDGNNYLNVYVPKKGKSVNVLENYFSSNIVNVSGVFLAERDFDSKYVILPIDIVRQILQLDEEYYSGVEFKLRDDQEIDIPSLKSRIHHIVGENFDIKTKREQNEFIYKIINMESFVSYFMLTLILIISMFGVIGSLSILIVEKKEHMRVLFNLGLELRDIKKIFIYEGLIILSVGFVFGTIICFIMCFLQDYYGLITLGKMSSVAYPVNWKWNNFIIVLFTVYIIGYITSYLTVNRMKMMSNTI
ncbi:lipoprotein releasing system transmembrane protein lolC [Ichthyobacterium seriolicida]|uniref:Lipoprotein releasing system transmembrane protein lolC n=1 Tax=Ichthyobacterium seriolicida TaxID=242600 RepID=A0A1J1DYS0_9FLAO|nr:lipoprotein releasing system transmembrane protein lolC [Ichthyobacterium seriolicida]